MRIGEICTRHPATCLRTTTVAEVARLMRERHVGSVIVVEQAPGTRPRPIGIVTDRDLVIDVMAEGIDPQTLRAEDLLTGSLHTVNECESVYDAVWRMRGQGVRRLPVVDEGGALVGVLAADDAMRILSETMADVARVVPVQLRQERQRG